MTGKSIRQQIQLLSPESIFEFFIIDLPNNMGGGRFYFHAGTNDLNQPVVWQGKFYQPMPIKATGFDISGEGKLPRPKLKVVNLHGLISAELQTKDDLLGCQVTRKRTMQCFLDAENFPDGVNPDANPEQHFPDDVWFIDQKNLETCEIVEFELASVYDLMGVQLPNRQVIRNSCQWDYRGAECGYTGPAFDKDDKPTSIAGADFCPKRLSSCRARKNYFADGIIMFGGFPGATRA
ncbi:tail protein [Xenorhabdus khoisanae]|uniref:Tail protein n=1 Tax=Xenorhabdus khoisanae TaxID=880157 RepID=A0A0J5FRM3_9GAMM|nr:phage minor tail protein L [Xenorhabdus khoisanae]KMJ44951.1 tail protein [Xenorhabdus khoisanae]